MKSDARGRAQRDHAHQRNWFAARLCTLALLLGTTLPERLQADSPEGSETRDSISPPRAGQSVRTRGVVTWEVPGYEGLVFVQESSRGVLVARTNLEVRPCPGDVVEVVGESAADRFQAMIRNARIDVAGAAPLPVPSVQTARSLASEIHFGEWVRLKCMVHDAGMARGDLVLQVTSGTQPFYAYVETDPGFKISEDLVDSTVELTGVVWTLAGPDQRPYGFRLHVPRPECMRVLKPGNRDFYERPMLTAKQLRRLPASQDDHVRVRGTVTHVYSNPAPYRIVVEDATGPIAAYLHVPISRDRNVAPYWRDDPQALWQQRPAPPKVAPGDLIEIIGSPSAEGKAVPLLHGGEYRVIGTGSPIQPRLIRAREALSPELDHALVRLKARVIDRQQSGSGAQLSTTIWLESDAMFFEARLLGPAAAAITLSSNSLAELTGLVLALPRQPGKPRGIQIELRGPEDIRSLAEPSPLFSAVVLRWLGISTGGLLLALAWVWLLRRQVARRTFELAASIEERKRTEKELLKALERERELGKLKSNLVSVVSHEFRTPLGVIVSSSDILRRYLDRLTPAKRQEQLEVIQRATENLSELVEDVLLLGKVEAGKVQFVPEPLDLGRLCRHLVDEIQSATKAACPIEFEEGNLAGAFGDESLLRPILSNLLLNAVKYSEPGTPVYFKVSREAVPHESRLAGVPARSSSSTWAQSNLLMTAASVSAFARFAISDRGIGISADDQKRLFSAFTRGSNVGDRPGTGLGLAIVKRCVELHGGSIELTSAPGEGTTMVVHLPMFNTGL